MRKAFIIVLVLTGSGAAAQDFDQLTRPVARVADPAVMELILHELLIPVPDKLARMEVVDLTANGYGPDDTLILYPSLETYLVGADVPRRLQDVMKTWEIETDYRLDATVDEGARMAEDAHSRQDAQGALSADVLAAVEHYYGGENIKMRLARGATGLRLEMWNYDPASMRYRPGRACTNDGQMFSFARPAFVMRFRDASGCLVASQRDGMLDTQPCADSAAPTTHTP